MLSCPLFAVLPFPRRRVIPPWGGGARQSPDRIKEEREKARRARERFHNDSKVRPPRLAGGRFDEAGGDEKAHGDEKAPRLVFSNFAVSLCKYVDPIIGVLLLRKSGHEG